MVMQPYRPNMLPKAFEEMEDLMDRWMVGWPFNRAWRRTPTQEHLWSPAIQLVERNNKYIVKADLPGVDKDDVDISVSDNVLTIKGERKEMEEIKDEDIHYAEISFGSFTRSLTLPSKVDADKINATFENGVLEVTLPMATSVLPRKIEVKTK
jgi:HSP20 family protein